MTLFSEMAERELDQHNIPMQRIGGVIISCFHSTLAKSKALESFYEYGVIALQAARKTETISPVLLLYFFCI